MVIGKEKVNKQKMNKMSKKCKGFVLIREYPNSKKLGSFEPFTTGEFLKYPEIWTPIFEGDVILTEETKNYTVKITITERN